MTVTAGLIPNVSVFMLDNIIHYFPLRSSLDLLRFSLCHNYSPPSHTVVPIPIFQLAMAASTSTAANPDSCNDSFDVFINHRGPDVKKTFASYLYRRLRLHKLKVFLDQQELQKGVYLTSQIQGAITAASVHVAIYSPRYAESSWCLNELMLETGKTIIPVFYHVRPAELRWTYDPEKNGQYAVSLQNLAEKKTYDPETQQYKS